MECYRKFFKKFYPKICQDIFPKKQTLKEVNFIEKTLGLPPAAKILDLCSGHGRHAIELAKRGYSVVCQDFNKNLLRISKELATKADIPIATICQDMRKIPFENEFDGIINMWSSFGYLKNRKEDIEVLNQVSKALNSSGKFFFDLDNNEWIFRHFNEKRKYKFEHLKVSGTSQLEIGKRRIITKLLLQEKGKRPEKNYSELETFIAKTIRILNDCYSLIEEQLPTESITGIHQFCDTRFTSKKRRNCGVAMNGVTVGHDGKIALCQSLLDAPIGNIYESEIISSVQNQNQIPNKEYDIDKYADCKDCQWRYICGGGCPLLTKQIFGKFNARSPYCEIFKSVLPKIIKIMGRQAIKKVPGKEG